MPSKFGSESRAENPWGFWIVGLLYLAVAVATIFFGYIAPDLHIVQ